MWGFFINNIIFICIKNQKYEQKTCEITKYNGG